MKPFDWAGTLSAKSSTPGKVWEVLPNHLDCWVGTTGWLRLPLGSLLARRFPTSPHFILCAPTDDVSKSITGAFAVFSVSPYLRCTATRSHDLTSHNMFPLRAGPWPSLLHVVRVRPICILSTFWPTVITYSVPSHYVYHLIPNSYWNHYERCDLSQCYVDQR